MAMAISKRTRTPNLIDNGTAQVTWPQIEANPLTAPAAGLMQDICRWRAQEHPRYRADTETGPEWFVHKEVAHTRAEFYAGTRNAVDELIDLGWIEPATWLSHEGYRIVDTRLLDRFRKHRPPIPKWLRDSVMERDGWKCVKCGSTEKLHLDHIYPHSLGGPDTEDNLQALCADCNLSKGARV